MLPESDGPSKVSLRRMNRFFVKAMFVSICRVRGSGQSSESCRRLQVDANGNETVCSVATLDEKSDDIIIVTAAVDARSSSSSVGCWHRPTLVATRALTQISTRPAGAVGGRKDLTVGW